MARWATVLTDSNYNPIGEILNAADRRFSFRGSGIPTASLRTRMDNPLAQDIVEGTKFLKLYRGSALKFFGPIIATQEVGQQGGASIQIEAAGLAWILTRRYVGKSSTGTRFANFTDRASIARQLIDEVNTETETGIETNAAWATSGSTTTYTAGPYALLSETMNDLANAPDGFDWEIRPREPSAFSRSGKIGQFYAAASFGSVKAEAIFEFGIGRHNIVSYEMNRTRDTQANHVIHLTETNGRPVATTRTDTASITEFTRLEDIVQAQLTDTALIGTLLDDHIRIRKNPRRVIVFQPHVIDTSQPGRVPEFGVDYDVGDQVRARAKIDDAVRFDAYFRVYGAEVALSPEGTEQITLTLIDAD